MPNAVKVHTDPDHRPRMELSIMDPIRLEYLHPQFVGDDLVIHTSMNSAWGNYDVNEQDPDGITVSVGYASLSDEFPSADKLFDAADAALYAAKEGGRNRVSGFNGSRRKDDIAPAAELGA